MNETDNALEPAATILQFHCLRRGSLHWMAFQARSRLREGQLDESARCLARKSHAVAATFSQRSFGKISWRTFDCAQRIMNRVRSVPQISAKKTWEGFFGALG